MIAAPLAELDRSMGKTFPNLGAEKLAAAGTISAVAKKLGIADRTVAGWRAGKLPNGPSAYALETSLGIARDAWTHTATGGADASAAPVARPVRPAGELEAAGRQTAKERLQDQLVRLREQREAPGLTERSRIELEKLELAASSRLARLEGAVGLSLGQVVASPHMRRILDAVADALHDTPLSLFAVLNAVHILDDKAPTSHLDETEKDHPAECAAVRAANAALCAAMSEWAAARRRQTAA